MMVMMMMVMMMMMMTTMMMVMLECDGCDDTGCGDGCEARTGHAGGRRVGGGSFCSVDFYAPVVPIKVNASPGLDARLTLEGHFQADERCRVD